MVRTMIAAALLAAQAGGALAQEVRLGRPGADNVYVWTDLAAFREAVKLIEANVHETNPALVTRLLACAPRPGDRAAIVEDRGASLTIVVTEGRAAGCRGLVTKEELGR